MNAVMMNGTLASSGGDEPLERLLQTLTNVIALQVLGYAFKKSGIMPADRAAGLGFFVANIALPSLLFRSLATLDVSIVNPAVVGAALISKTCLLYTSDAADE